MKIIESSEDILTGSTTYYFDDGRAIKLSGTDLRLFGLESCLEDAGIKLDPVRLPVTWRGRAVGVVPAAFDPMNVRSNTCMYRPRKSDFVRTKNGFEASGSLEINDLLAVYDFIPSLEVFES